MGTLQGIGKVPSVTRDKRKRELPSRRPWAQWEDEILVATYPHLPTAVIANAFKRGERSIYARAKLLGLQKSEAYLASPDAYRLRRDSSAGIPHRFQKGHVPANKGQKGVRVPGTEKTWFKAGSRSGRAAALYKPLGTERVSKDGYLERKVNDDMPLQKRWRAVHLLVWEAANGPLPPGHAVAFKDGNRRNVALDNLELISRRELMLRNTVHNLGPELAEVIQLRGAVTRQINKRERKTG